MDNKLKKDRRSKTEVLNKFLNDSAWFCMEKLKNIVLRPKILKDYQKSKNIFENVPPLGFPPL